MEELIEYKTPTIQLNVNGVYTLNLQTFDVRGLTCYCGRKRDNDGVSTITWDFNWTKLVPEGVDSISGIIQVDNKPSGEQNYTLEKFEILLTKYLHSVTKKLVLNESSPFSYNVTLIASRFTREMNFEELFLPSAKHDGVLIVEGKKLNVNKAFLSYHSEYFEALFSSNFKEGKMDEIKIKDVSFDDFGLMMGIIYPDSTFPTDRNTEKLLEMADRFMIRSVIARVEYHLLHNSKIGIVKMTWMADKYRMQNLTKKVLLLINSIAVAKQIKASAQYKELSDQMKAKILDRVLEFFNFFLF